MEKKKILIPGGKLSDLALVNAAHRLGLYVITSGTHPHAPAHKYADEYVYADYSDKEAMLQLAVEKNRLHVLLYCPRLCGHYKKNTP